MKKTLRLILGDQLNLNHSWFENKSDNVIYFMTENQEETGYVKHHIQKVVAYFLSMRNFKKDLESQGHRVIYFQIDDKVNQQVLSDNLDKIIKEEEIEHFEYLYPDEYRLDINLKTILQEA